ncbi:hypothetical protein DPMN_012576 [Dreissena polymorpha]|uniref:Uncharacterized protein n=1 Tax=Dreissena polymorpha TaxID=45954 RepID=A0A9D4S2V7_DREPO|nr:hypothetical protein DPMN_012576 [Dreissena polymorpha]
MKSSKHHNDLVLAVYVRPLPLYLFSQGIHRLICSENNNLTRIQECNSVFHLVHNMSYSSHRLSGFTKQWQ